MGEVFFILFFEELGTYAYIVIYSGNFLNTNFFSALQTTSSCFNI